MRSESAGDDRRHWLAPLRRRTRTRRLVSIGPVAAALITLAIPGVATAKPRSKPTKTQPAKSQPAKSQPPKTAQPKSPLPKAVIARWWTRKQPCPKGSKLSGAPPPKGFNVSCSPSGFWTYWHAHGQLLRPGRQEGGIANGRWHYYYDNGQLELSQAYRAAEKWWAPHGWVKGWHRNGTLTMTGHYHRYWDGSGKLVGTVTMNDGTGHWIAWHANGRMAERGDKVKGFRHGRWRAWHKNGKRWIEETFKHGRGHGVQHRWDQQGRKQFEAHLVDGKVRRRRSWYTNGKLKSDIHYRARHRHGQATEWYPSGQLKSQASYINGKRNGLARSWWPKGQLETERRYDYGRRRRPSKAWDKAGKPVNPHDPPIPCRRCKGWH